MEFRKLFRLFLLAICSMNCIALYAQQKDTTKLINTKLLPPTFVEKMQRFAKEASKESNSEFEADKAAIVQASTFDEITKLVQKSKTYLKTGVDTIGTRKELTQIQKDYLIAGDGVFTNPGTAQTFRNLTATGKILAELLKKAETRRIQLNTYRHELNRFRYQIDSLLSVPELFKFSSDSITLFRYIQKIAVVNYETHPVDSSLKQAANNIQSLLNEVNLVAFKLEGSLEEIELYQQRLAAQIYNKEFGSIWEKQTYYRPFAEILHFSKIKGLLTLSFYAEHHINLLIILLLLAAISYTYLRSLKSIYISQKLLNNDLDGQLVLRHPSLSAILLVLNIFQFIFLSPPFILNVIIWTISCICLTIIFKNYISRFWMGVWLTMVLLFLIAAVDNLILQSSRIERWLILVIALAGVLAGIVTLIKGRKHELKEKWITYAIGLMVLLELVAVIANVFGRYNFAKTLFISGFLNVVIAILFLWTVRLINEGLYLAYSVYSGQDKKLFYLNFERVGVKAPALFYLLLMLGWLVLFGRNFPAYEYFTKPFKAFFGQERTLGDYTFNINNLLLFVVIMAVAVMVSKVVSYFAADKHLAGNRDDKQSGHGIGSWILLVRISILGIGLFLAIAAAGIPIDRITIVLGALGVGIGFGLQTLVNNLVSGLIIAFEKPVNVGDVVDVDGQAGVMKSIGFRSSVISTWDGADVVMPNGDLLNSHLVNWSLGGGRKRMTLSIGIAYGADLEKCRQLLAQILDSQERIIKNPQPVVQYEQFGDSAIQIKIYFWTKHLRDAAATKSELIIAITNAFNENGISIPYAQQEVYVHYPEKP